MAGQRYKAAFWREFKKLYFFQHNVTAKLHKTVEFSFAERPKISALVHNLSFPNNLKKTIKIFRKCNLMCEKYPLWFIIS